MSFESTMDFTKKIPSLLSFIASIVFNNSVRVENYIYWICLDLTKVTRPE